MLIGGSADANRPACLVRARPHRPRRSRFASVLAGRSAPKMSAGSHANRYFSMITIGPYGREESGVVSRVITGPGALFDASWTRAGCVVVVASSLTAVSICSDSVVGVTTGLCTATVRWLPRAATFTVVVVDDSAAVSVDVRVDARVVLAAIWCACRAVVPGETFGDAAEQPTAATTARPATRAATGTTILW